MESLILNSKGQPYTFRAIDPTQKTRANNMSGGYRSEPEGETLPYRNRVKIIGYLRESQRTNPIVASLIQRFSIGIGCPSSIKCETSDIKYNDAKERYLEKNLKRIFGKHDLKRVLTIINSELLIAGEVFIVFAEDGQIQLVPSELCGSPEKNAPKGEVEGIGYAKDGSVKYYRFGRRNEKGEIVFDKTSQKVDAAFVKHLGIWDRVEMNRPAPPLTSAIQAIQDVDEILRAKVTQIKNQSAFSLFITKENPEEYTKLLAEDSGDALAAFDPFARSNYQSIKTGSIYYGEMGESVTPITANINATDFASFEFSLLQRICSVVGIPVEELKGYNLSNYSSSRADKLRWSQIITSTRSDIESYFLNDLVDWLTLRGEAGKEIPEAPADNTNSDLIYLWPELPIVDEAVSTSSAIALIEAGLSTKSEQAIKRGRLPDQLEAQRVQEAVILAQLVKGAAAKSQGIQYNGAVTEDEIKSYLSNGVQAAAALASLANINKAA